ncbi:hypothetical protein D3C81_2279440 [compost metagenome]
MSAIRAVKAAWVSPEGSPLNEGVEIQKPPSSKCFNPKSGQARWASLVRRALRSSGVARQFRA